jgi:hypothetical protein
MKLSLSVFQNRASRFLLLNIEFPLIVSVAIFVLQVWRTREGPDLYRCLRPALVDLPPGFRAQSYHIGINPNSPPLDLLRELAADARSRGGGYPYSSFMYHMIHMGHVSSLQMAG